MESRTMQNLPPDDAQRSALGRLVAQQELMVANLEHLYSENTAEYRRLDQNAQILQNTAASMKILRDIGTQMQSRITPLFLQLDTELLSLEANYPVLSSLLSSSAPFVQQWNMVRDAVATLLSVLKRPLEHAETYAVSLVEELNSTETLREQMSEAVATLSTMINAGVQSSKYKREGILHPLRRLPPEILLQIFHECVTEEVEDLRNQLPFSEATQSPVILAGVCTQWRRIVQHNPRFWSYICLPNPNPTPSSLHTFQFAHALSLSEGVPIELTVTPHVLGVNRVEERSLARRAIRRLNIGNAAHIWPPVHSSPEYLWIGHEDSAPLTRTIPAALISRTTHLVCSNVRPVFLKENGTVETVVISGIDFGPFLGSMMRKLPHLRHLDMTQLRLGPLNTTFNRHLSHTHFSSLAIHSSALGAIEFYLAQGLRLPSLHRLTLDGLDNHTHLSSYFPLMSSYFKTTVTTLEISGTSRSGPIQSWMETLTSLTVFVAYKKDATLPVLEALYKACDVELTPLVRSPSKGSMSIILREYSGDGTEVLQILRDIRQNAAVGPNPIKIVLEGCLNILPEIRAELSKELNGAPFQSGVTVEVDYDMNEG
jgi:hypothetical protein